jgi:hypothetical protein
LLIASAMLFAALPASAPAQPLVLADVGQSGSSPQVAGRWIVWSDPDRGATRLDVVTGIATRIDPVPGCGFSSMDRDGDVLFDCDRGGRVRDGQTGALTALPELATGWTSTTLDVQYLRIGRHGVALLALGYKSSAPAFIRRDLGKFVWPLDDAHHQIDLDRPTLARRLCRGMRRPRVPDDDFGLMDGDLAVAGHRAAAVTHLLRKRDDRDTSRVVVKRCGQRSRTLERGHDPFVAQDPVIDGRTLAWVSGRFGGHFKLSVLSLRNGRRRSIRLPGEGPFSALLVAGRLYISAEGRLLRVKR